MEKLIKVTKAPAKRGYIEAVKLSGNYLRKYGFNMGDDVKVTIGQGEINIKLITENCPY